MQVRQNNSLQKRLKKAYTTHRSLCFATYTTLLGMSILLVEGAGMLLPGTWRVLAQVFPVIPQLWMKRGYSLALPLTLLIVQVLTWPILGYILLRAWLTILRLSRQTKHARQNVDFDFVAWQLAQSSHEAHVDMHNQITDAMPAQQLSSSPFWTFDPRSLHNNGPTTLNGKM